MQGACGPLASSSAQRKHGPDRSRDAPILVAARPRTPASTWLAGDGAPPSFGKRERCPMALTAPINTQTPPLIAGDVHGSEVVAMDDELQGVKGEPTPTPTIPAMPAKRGVARCLHR